jgi:probable HAF family extracellular repeat protein
MSTAATSANAELTNLLEEYAARLQAGEPLDAEAFAAAHPEHAEVLRKLLPTMRVLAEMGSSPGASDGAGHDPHTGTLGDFRIVREVGRGGMGVVYEAEQISLGRRVALKVLPFAATMDPRHLQRFHNEARAAACLHHPHIVPVHFVGCERSVHFYAMQLIDGRSLAAFLADLRKAAQPAAEAESGDEQRTTLYAPAAVSTVRLAAVSTERTARGREYYRRVAELGVQAAQALDYAHERGVIHRDVKPANLLLDGHGDLWITDFGLAHLQNAEASLTMSGDLVGTLRYMSPEQALAQRVVIDHRTDVYSLGATLYELLTLEPAFNGRDRQELLRQIAFEEPLAPRRLERSIPAELETIVLKAVEKNPADRYATAQELADDLERWLKDEPIRARRPTLLQWGRKWARRHRSVVASLAVGLVTLLVVGVVAAFGYQRRLAGTDRGVTAALVQAETYLSEGDSQIEQPERWQATTRLALAAVQKAEELLAAGTATAALARRVEEVRAAVDAAVAGSGLRVEVDRIRLEQAAVKDDRFDKARAAPLYAKAAADYGIDLAEPEVAAARVRGSRLRDVLLAALHDWARITQDAGERRQLEAVLRAAEPKDTFRLRWLAAARRGDKAALVKLALEPQVQQLPIADIAQLGRDLHDVKEWAAAERLLRPAQARKPGDFWLNHNLGLVLTAQGPSGAAEAVGFLRVALAQRSDSPGVYLNLGVALSEKGDKDGAILCYQAALKIDPNYAMAHRNLGNALSAKGLLEHAIAAYRKALAIQKDYVEAHHGLGNALSDNGQLDEAIAEFKKITAINKDDAKAYCNLGNALLRKGQLDAAIAACQKAIELQPRLVEAYSILGCALCEKGDVPRAIDACKKAIALQPDFYEAYRNLGAALTAKGDLTEAVAAYRKAIAIKKDDASAYNGLGIALRRQGRLNEAIAAYREAIAINRAATGIKQEYAEAHYNLGNALRQQGKPNEAIAAYQEAIRLKPDFAQAHNGLGVVLCDHKHDYDGAIAAFDEAICLKPDDPLYRCNLGNALHNKGRLAEAIAAYREAIRLKQNDVHAHNGLGNALLAKGQVEEAIAAYREAIRLKPDYAEAHNNLGIALERKGEVEEAIAAYREAIRLKKDYLEAHHNLGLALAAKGQLDEAIAEFREAIRLNKDYALAHNGLGTALYAKGQVEEAIAAYHEAIRIQKNYPDAHHNLGLALGAKGKVEEAIACFRKAIEIDPKHAYAHKGLAWLLATCSDAKLRDPDQAVKLAKKAVQLAPKMGDCWYTLGVAHYRAGDWKAAIAALNESVKLGKGGDAYDFFSLRPGDRLAGEEQGSAGKRQGASRRTAPFLPRSRRGPPAEEEVTAPGLENLAVGGCSLPRQKPYRSERRPGARSARRGRWPCHSIADQSSGGASSLEVLLLLEVCSMQRTNTWEHLLRLVLRPRGSAARQPHRRPPSRPLCLEALEDRHLLSSYTITVIGPGLPNTSNAINNASVAQVVGTNASNDHAYLWDSLHGLQDLGTVNHDLYSAACGINDSGQVVGLSFTLTYGEVGSTLTSEHAFLWTANRGMQNIGNRDAASGINRAGEVSGTIDNSSVTSAVAGIWNGKWTSLGTLGGGQSHGAGINSAGQAVGYSYVSGVQQAFLWTPAAAGGTTGTLQALGTFGGANSDAAAINGQGYVTGSAELPGGSYIYHAFVWRPASANGTSGTLTDLDPLGTGNSGGASINSSGLVVGSSDDNTSTNFAVLWQPGANGYTMSNLNSLIPAGTGWNLQDAAAINDSGQIVVKATSSSLSGWYDLLLTPATRAQPAASPQTSAVFGSVLATADPLHPTVAGATLTASTQAAPPTLSTAGSTLPSGPSSTEGSGILQSTSDPGTSPLVSWTAARHVLDQVDANQDSPFGDP